MGVTKFHEIISKITSISTAQVESVIMLMTEQGATIPFISRYRKEATKGLDEVQIGLIKDEYDRLCEIEKRKETIIDTIEKLGEMTPELRSRIDECYVASVLEDIYLPYKPKRRTRATIAKGKGLEPLAAIIMKQNSGNIESTINRFCVGDIDFDEAISGAKDIIAEWVNEREAVRNRARSIFESRSMISSLVAKGKEGEGIKYSDYFDYKELYKKAPSHRILAIERGHREGFLKVSIEIDDKSVIEQIERIVLKDNPGNNESSKYVNEAISDSYKRLLRPSIETELLSSARERADDEAIKVFAENLRQLLLAAPLGQKSVLAIDPGYRTGCKVVCLDKQGNLAHNETIYPHPPQNEQGMAMKKISSLVEAYNIDAIAIGDGTASRETEAFIKRIHFPKKVDVFMVSEDGASVYSASSIAREEFSSYDVTVRGSVSIGRRLMDPLAELVKIDPKAIGVGQYQHDVDQSKLKKRLDTIVESCVNLVGVNLNTASKHLLAYVSGIGETLAKNIVDYRSANGAFSSRDELKKVPRLGAKAYEQCAGFMRIAGSRNPLDNSAVHPESYCIVEKMASDLGVGITQIISDAAIRNTIDITKYVSEKIGIPTLSDIMSELNKPGRDPRNEIKKFEFDDTIHSIDDLREGMIVPGIVTNITNFGAFVDIGIKQDGLVHISSLADKFVSSPAEVVKLHQHVKVKVTSIDYQRKRIQLSMKSSDLND